MEDREREPSCYQREYETTKSELLLAQDPERIVELWGTARTLQKEAKRERARNLLTWLLDEGELPEPTWAQAQSLLNEHAPLVFGDRFGIKDLRESSGATQNPIVRLLWNLRNGGPRGMRFRSSERSKLTVSPEQIIRVAEKPGSDSYLERISHLAIEGEEGGLAEVSSILLASVRAWNHGLQGISSTLDGLPDDVAPSGENLPPGAESVLVELLGVMHLAATEGDHIESEVARKNHVEDAIHCFKQIQEIRSDDLESISSISEALFIADWADALTTRWRLRGRIEDLEDAIRLHKRSVRIASLGLKAAKERHAADGASEGASDETLDVVRRTQMREQVDLWTEEKLERLISWAAALQDRHEHLGKPEGRDKAVGQLRDAKELAQRRAIPGTQWLAKVSCRLARILVHRWQEEGNPNDLEEARNHLLDAWDASPYSGRLRLEIGALLCKADRLGDTPNWERIMETCHSMYEVVEESEERYLAIGADSMRETLLETVQDLPRLWATGLAHTGAPWEAVKALEKTRTRLMQDAMAVARDRTLLGELEEDVNPELHDAYLSETMEIQTIAETAQRSPHRFEEEIEDTLSAAADRLEGIEEQIRSIPGFEDFRTAMRKPLENLPQSLVPVVYLVPGPHNGMALIVESTRGDSQVASIELPHLTSESLSEKLESHSRAYRRLKDALQAGGVSPGNPSAMPLDEWLDSVENTSRWARNEAMAPLLNHLGHPEEILLIPVGQASSIPWHIAEECNREGGDRATAVGTTRIVYAPSLSATVDEETRQSETTRDLRLIVDPTPTPLPRLPGALLESTGIHRISTYNRVRSVKREEATLDRVLRGMGDSWALHFAGHAEADMEDPYNSCLYLADDQKLRAKDLHSSKVRVPEAVILSACEAGVPGRSVPDEVIGLPTTLIQAGAKAVISTEWLVPDRVASIMMTRFHELMGSEGATLPEALTIAQEWYRKATPAQLAEYSREKLRPRARRSAPEPGGSIPTSTPTIARFGLRGTSRSAEESPMELWRSMCHPATWENLKHPAFWGAFKYTGLPSNRLR